MKLFINKVYRSLIAFIFFLIIVSFFNTAKAERSIEIKDIKIEAQILNDASMNVTEKITVYFNGKWNGFYINIAQSNNNVISDIIVSENNQPYKFNQGSKYGPPGTYLTKKDNDKIIVDWSINAENQQRIFVVSYKVSNAVKIHNDIAEFYRKFISATNKHNIDDVSIKITLPNASQSYIKGKDIKIWGHGPLNGEIKFLDDNQVVLSSEDFNANQFLEARIIMPTALFNNVPSMVYTNKNALEEILKEESKWASEANNKRMMVKLEIILSILLVFATIILTAYLWIKYGKNHKTVFNGEYCRELPAEYTPAELSVLWNFDKIKAQDITATILDLARRKFLKIDEEKSEEKNIIWKNKIITRYKVSILNPTANNLKQHEQFLLDYFRQHLASVEQTFYIDEIESFSKNHKKSFYKFWLYWQEAVRIETEQYKFFEPPSNMPVVTLISGLIIFILGCIVIQEQRFLGSGLIISGAILGLVPRLFKRHTTEGREDFVKWRAFKNFLTDFSEMEKHEIPSLIIWEHYLVYAVTLGVADKVIKQLSLMFPDMKDGDITFGYGWYYYNYNANSFNNFNQSMENMISSIETSIAIATKDNKSSETGDGGGFSSGGGSGSGGSSYGGR